MKWDFPEEGASPEGLLIDFEILPCDSHEKNPSNRGFMANQPTPPGHVSPPRNKGLIFGLIKGTQWLISP